MEARSVYTLDHRLPLDFYPQELRINMQETALQLLSELVQYRLRVVLCDAPEPKYAGHMVRRVEEENPVWYRELWWRYAYTKSPYRKPRSLIRRSRVSKSLQRVGAGKDLLSTGRFGSYDAIIRELTFEQMQKIQDLLHNKTAYGSLDEDLIPF